MRRLRLCTLLAAIAVAAMASAVRADFTPIDGPVEDSSWKQRFVGDVGSYNALFVFRVSGDYFESPTFRGFASAGWSVVSNLNQTAAKATKSSLAKNEQFDIYFRGSTSPGTSNVNPVTFDFLAFNDATLVDSAHAKWNGATWSFTAFTSSEKANASRAAAEAKVPEPFSIINGAGVAVMMLLALVWRRRRT